MDRVGFAFDQHATDYVTNGGDSISRYPAVQAGWYYDYMPQTGIIEESGIDYRYHMVWSVPKVEAIQALVTNHPTDVLIAGNEPDIAGQQNMTPAQYATFYRDVVAVVRSVDPDYPVAIAGVSNGANRGIAYLQAVLTSYWSQYGEPMPIDVWTIHLYDSMPIPDQIAAVRQLMQSNGYQDKSLIVTEFAGSVELMVYGYDWLLRAQGEIGQPSDDYRLVQGAAWFSLNSYPGFPSYLYDKETLQPTVYVDVFNNLLAGSGCGHGEIAHRYFFPMIVWGE